MSLLRINFRSEKDIMHGLLMTISHNTSRDIVFNKLCLYKTNMQGQSIGGNGVEN